MTQNPKTPDQTSNNSSPMSSPISVPSDLGTDNNPFLSTPLGGAQDAPPDPSTDSPTPVFDAKALLARVAGMQAELDKNSAASKVLQDQLESERVARGRLEMQFGKATIALGKKQKEVVALEQSIAELRDLLDAERNARDAGEKVAELTAALEEVKDTARRDVVLLELTGSKLRDLLSEERKSRAAAEEEVRELSLKLDEVKQSKVDKVASLNDTIKFLRENISKAHAKAILTQVDLTSAREERDDYERKFQNACTARDIAYRGYLKEQRLREEAEGSQLPSSQDDNDERMSYPPLVRPKNSESGTATTNDSEADNSDDGASGWTYDPSLFQPSISAPAPRKAKVGLRGGTKAPTLPSAPNVKKTLDSKHRRSLATDATATRKRVAGGDRIADSKASKATASSSKSSLFITPGAVQTHGAPSAFNKPGFAFPSKSASSGPSANHTDTEVIEISDDSDTDDKSSALELARPVTPSLKRTQAQAQVTPSGKRSTRARKSDEKTPKQKDIVLSGEEMAMLSVAFAAAPQATASPTSHFNRPLSAFERLRDDPFQSTAHASEASQAGNVTRANKGKARATRRRG